MKVTDLRKKLAATLAACGLLAPVALHAAPLNTNLIIEPGFEFVDVNTTGAEGAPKILGWDNGTTFGFAYSHNETGGVPDYANGGPLDGGGNYYFTPGNGGNQSRDTALVQLVDVSIGPSGTLIAGGTAAFNLSAFFGSYLEQPDYGIVEIDFLNASSVSLGTRTASPGPQALANWTKFSAAGLIPTGTTTVRVSAWGVLLEGGSSDGYMDNVDFRVTNEVIQSALEVTVDRANGSLTLMNRTGAAQNISRYQVTSAFEALNPAGWRSIADNYDADNPGANQVDAAHHWSKLTVPTAHGDLSEADLESGLGASLAHAQTVNLGIAGAWIQNPNEDLVFQYISNGAPVTGIVSYTGNAGQPLVAGDLNALNGITSADWAILRTNQHTALNDKSLAEAYRLGDLTGDRRNDHADFVAFKTLFEAAHGAGSFARMLAGVPEPSSALLVGIALTPLAARSRRRRDLEQIPKICSG